MFCFLLYLLFVAFFARIFEIFLISLPDYDVMESEQLLEVSMSRQLTSYRGYHKFVLNFVTFVFHSNGNVLVRATTMDSLTYMPYTSSKMHCNFGTIDDKGSVRLFYQ